MAINTINKNFKNRGKDIKYLNKDFDAFKRSLIEYTKTYFPKTYNDFSEAYYESENAPIGGVKVGGTPLSTQDQEAVQSYDFLQIESISGSNLFNSSRYFEALNINIPLFQ